MYSLLISIALLIAGYFIYGRIIEKIFNPDPKRQTPAFSKADGVDFIPLPTWKVFMIQFLNIAGTGPIFGAILGAKFGPSCYLWIVLGCIFGGATHDYLSGMMSLRGDGKSLPNIIGDCLGKATRYAMVCFTIIMLMLVGIVFVYSPALILGDMTGNSYPLMLWIGLIMVYYVLATLVPIDKIIGKIYPLFAFALIFMAVALLGHLLVHWPAGVPEVWDGLENRDPASGSIFPCLFISIACGAISGFHATQSPLMARCMKSESLGRPIFYGSMITEGIIALIWATVSSYFFFAGGNSELGATEVTAAPSVVSVVSKGWLGTFGGILAILGVVAAPITSGDTAFRSLRLLICDLFKYNQKPIINRLIVSVPIFIIASLGLWYNISDKEGFNIVWRYFGWANQTLSIFTLLAITNYLFRRRKGLRYIVTLIPAAFMTSTCMAFISTQSIGLNLPESTIPYIGIITFCAVILLFGIYAYRNRNNRTVMPEGENI